MNGRGKIANVDRSIEGNVFDIQKFSLHDGPGIRTIVFLKGCPLACLWCSNPESREITHEILFNAEKCIGCDICRRICPRDAIKSCKSADRVKRELCDGCGRCADECPTQALQSCGGKMSVAAVLAEIEKDRAFYLSSNGGVTFSGGEPLQQIQFIKSLLVECKSRGMHTAVETCGHVNGNDLEQVLPYTDLFLYDVKHMDSTAHRKITGYDNRLMLENLEMLCRRGADVIPRMPVIAGLNDSAENLGATAREMNRLGLTEIHLLPYHNYGEGKYAMLGIEYPLANLDAMTAKDLEGPRLLLESYGLKVNIGGE
jgi:pyruvate formate lyase activating enzyme